MLSAKGYKVYVTALNRGKLPLIVHRELDMISNVEVAIVGRHRMTKFSAVIEANLLRIPKMMLWKAKKQ